MRPVLFVSIALLATAPSAQAARVTNLDSVPHTVTFAQAGTVMEQVVQPNRTVYFPRQDGIIGMKGGNPGKDTLNSSGGLLSGVIGAARTSQIPAGPGDDFTIWKGGELRLQRRVKGLMGGN